MMALQTAIANAVWYRQLRDFLRWWKDGLRLCLPLALRSRLGGKRIGYELESEAGDILLYRRALSDRQGSGEAGQELGRWPLGGPMPGQVSKLVKSTPLTLRLPANKVLQRVLELPLAVENELGAMLDLGLDRYVPFKANQVYFDYRVEARERATGKLRLRLAVVPRGVVDPLLEALERQGIFPLRVDANAPARGFNLLPRERRPRHSRASRGWMLGLAVSLALLLVAVLVIPLWQQRSVVVALIKQVDHTRAKAERVSSLRNELEGAYETGRFLTEKKQASTPAIDVLRELTEILPDGTWLQQMELKDGKVQIRGESSDATALIGLLDASPWFTDPVFRSPVTRNPATKQERFFLEAGVVRPSSTMDAAT